MFSSCYEEFETIISKVSSLSKDGFLSRSEELYQCHKKINDIHNLTRIVSPAEFFEKHIVDSLMIGLVEPAIMNEKFKIADIGCGGGFPCLPLAMVNPQLEITGIESLNKKVSAVNLIAEQCGLTGVKVEKYRAREAARLPQFNQQFDIVTARAVASVEVLIKECRQFLNEGGKMLFYKTPEAIKKEMALAERESKKFKFKLSVSEVYTLSESSGDRQFYIIQK